MRWAGSSLTHRSPIGSDICWIRFGPDRISPFRTLSSKAKTSLRQVAGEDETNERAYRA
jgi:hypothetical protein